MEHKNFEYLCSAKCLNARQVMWTLFFNCFNFNLAYQPGSKNCKAEDLSCQFDTTEEDPTPNFIVFLSACLGVTRVDMKQES